MLRLMTVHYVSASFELTFATKHLKTAVILPSQMSGHVRLHKLDFRPNLTLTQKDGKCHVFLTGAVIRGRPDRGDGGGP